MHTDSAWNNSFICLKINADVSKESTLVISVEKCFFVSSIRMLFIIFEIIQIYLDLMLTMPIEALWFPVILQPFRKLICHLIYVSQYLLDLDRINFSGWRV